jgi:hypothetical protein
MTPDLRKRDEAWIPRYYACVCASPCTEISCGESGNVSKKLSCPSDQIDINWVPPLGVGFHHSIDFD